MNNEIETITIVFKDKTVVVLGVGSMRIINPDMVEQIQTEIERMGVIQDKSV
ncbi:hypothetical protein [Leptospira noguchii]|uniref:Uncharacterized protein n=1 Tax=Leptospira noguchii TaxID=28182 RepID=A0AAE9GKZ6_9LEPT|nr:hypothetical protein [Leptospira noguchii]EMI68898.1 hypothetical protein LEP1GSC072_2309 [Leptospira noguchii str. Bonito]UOG54613.1 hypothetical protein MAL09_20450 [Leptospira noguchii]UOG58658.1 hypothetical protein MAL03_18520 [Leptospira noguchii]